MKLLAQAFFRLWLRKRLWLQETLLLAALLAAAYGWLSLPVAGNWHLALHVLTALAMLSVAVFGVRLAWRAFAPCHGAGILAEAHFWLALVIWVAAGLWLPVKLIWWIPELAGLPMQAASAAVRFLLAGLLFAGGLLWLLSCLSRGHEPRASASGSPA